MKPKLKNFKQNKGLSKKVQFPMVESCNKEKILRNENKLLGFGKKSWYLF